MTADRVFRLVAGAGNGIVLGFAFVLVGVLPSSLAALVLGNGFYGVLVSLVAWAVMGVKSRSRLDGVERLRAENQQLRGRVHGLESVVSALAGLEYPADAPDGFDLEELSPEATDARAAGRAL